MTPASNSWIDRTTTETRVSTLATEAFEMDEPQEQVAITPHTLRHTAAMRLLHAGVDITVIALWLGHESPRPPRSTSTPTSPSRNARSHAPPPNTRPGRYRPPDQLLAFLASL
jgi:integrase/recombinase XerD